MAAEVKTVRTTLAGTGGFGAGQQQRYYPVPQLLARLIRENAIGEPI